MENSVEQKEENNIEVVQDGNLSKRLVKKVNGEQLMVLNIKNPQACIQESLVQGIYRFKSKIPIQISTIDEIYLRRCVELVRFSAFPKRTGLISTNCSSDVESFAIEYPLRNSDVDDSILGAISQSQSMVNILKSPLFQKFGSIDMDANSRTTSSSGVLSSGSTQNFQKKMVFLGDHTHGSDPVHKRVLSISSTNSTCSDMSSSTSNTVSHAILQCTWFEGNPHFVFSLEDQREVYVAKLVNRDSDHTYSFYSRTSNEKDSDIVGKMKVSTSLTISPNNSQVLATQFVLFGFIDTFVTESKNKGTSKKAGSIFRPGYISRQRTSSKFAGTSSSGTIQENSSWEPNQENVPNFQESQLLSNFELIAIVVKEHIDAVEEPKVGGWGLNFLKKVESTKIVSESRQRDISDCSTSMNIIIPAGFHGGPRIRIGGPSSLIDRWHSGGRCDCGGWDLGCPIRLLKSKSNDNSTEFDIITEGSDDQDILIMKMNGHDHLYHIHFQPPLSSLQSFAIATAIIHSRSPTFRHQESTTRFI
jgi:hypothetical protein